MLLSFPVKYLLNLFSVLPPTITTKKVKLSIREKYKILSSTPVGYAAALGDMVTINMRGFEKEAEEGQKKKPLPTVAGGDELEVPTVQLIGVFPGFQK